MRQARGVVRAAGPAFAALFALLALAILGARPAAGDSLVIPPVTPEPRALPGVTSVTRDPTINAQMGIKMIRVNEPGDSVRWWERSKVGWERWIRARALFPRAKSPTAELYLDSLADGFNRAVALTPTIRPHFYVADTLNPSLWPVGGGFFVVHAGLFREIRDERQFAFVVALELAHETLGHNMTPVRAGDVKWEPGSWRDGDYDGWPVEFWTYLVGHDPIVRGRFTYTLQQESDALELVYRFFRANAWEYDGINRLVADLLPTLDEIPGASSLKQLHENLAMAVRLPHSRPDGAIAPVDSFINREAYQRILVEIEHSPLQHYPWLLELVPYREFVVESDLDMNEIRQGYNPHADQDTKKIVDAIRKPRKAALSTELDAFLERNDDLDARDKLQSARLARIYLRGLILLAHHRWADAITSAEEGLKLNSAAEPFLWQRAQARQQLGQFAKFQSDQSVGWSYFDHRRELMLVQNEFLQGRYTDAARDAIKYRVRYPFDIDGAFWAELVQIRLRRPVDKAIDEAETFWGDRPIVRAMKVLHFGALAKLDEAQRALDYQTDIKYQPYEWGILEFAQAWLRQTYSIWQSDDERSEKLMQLAELQWPISRLVKYNLPRESVQNR